MLEDFHTRCRAALLVPPIPAHLPTSCKAAIQQRGINDQAALSRSANQTCDRNVLPQREVDCCEIVEIYIIYVSGWGARRRKRGDESLFNISILAG